MLPFLKKYWFNSLQLSVLALLLFYFLPKEKIRYLETDAELINQKSDTILLWIVSILLAFLLFWAIRKIRKFKEFLYLTLGVGGLGLAFFFLFNPVFLSAAFFINRLSKSEFVYKTYPVVFINKDKTTLLLWDSHLGKSINADQLLKNTDHQHINVSDSVIVSFTKGLLGFNFDPKITAVKSETATARLL